MKQFIATQTKTNEALSASINQLNSKFDAMAAHQKAMDTQIAQIAQQVNHLSGPPGHLLGQPKTNPKGHINVVSMMGEGLEKSPIMILQETFAVPKSVGTTEQNEEEGLSSNGKSTYTAPVARPYQPPVPHPQTLAWTKLSMLEPRFARFLDLLKRIYADTPFLEALRTASSYLKFMR